MRTDTYKTRQKQVILDCLKDNSHTSISAKDIEKAVAMQGIEIGKSTIYRHLDRLVADKQVRKFIDEESKSATYQYIDECQNCHKHMHLKCISCGKLLHLDCDFMADVNGHILDKHNFKIDNSKTVILGLCDKCDTDNSKG